MKRIFISLSMLLGALTLSAQSVVVCNFDDVVPSIETTQQVTIDYVEAEAPASGQMGALTVAAGNPGDGFLLLQTDYTIDPRDYVGISFLCKGDVYKGDNLANPPFILKLEQSASTDAGTTRIQDWNSYPRYTGQGQWQKVHVSFDICIRSLQEKLLADPNFPATSYDKIILCPAPYENMNEFTLYIDDIKLRTSWEDEGGNGIPALKTPDPIQFTSKNGVIRSKTLDGDVASLKVYSLSGQEIASGNGQVQIAGKGVYIVKATTLNASQVSKIILK
ncbi:MAG: T9SS type A sorting domain-containing protein [Dysgonamonadaceae bacterium]|nr:T9SS type A sorting domain-containing protein [Dysgonamonadaceae bacterium]